MKKKAKKTPKRANPPKGLIRFLKPGDKLEAVGKRGRPIKRIVSGREYVFRVRRGKSVAGFINRVAKGKPVPRVFTNSMVARLKHTRTMSGNKVEKITKDRKKYRFSSSRRVVDQVRRTGILQKIRNRPGEAFALRFRYPGSDYTGAQIYFDGKLSDEELENLVVSNFLYTLGQNKFRFSDRLKADPSAVYDPQSKVYVDKNTGEVLGKKPRVIDQVQLSLDFYKYQNMDKILKKRKGRKK